MCRLPNCDVVLTWHLRSAKLLFDKVCCKHHGTCMSGADAYTIMLLLGSCAAVKTNKNESGCHLHPNTSLTTCTFQTQGMC